MKKAIIVSSITLFILTGAFIYANSSKVTDKPEVVMTSDSTLVKPDGQKCDTTACAHSHEKGQKHEGCKKEGNSSCCKKK